MTMKNKTLSYSTKDAGVAYRNGRELCGAGPARPVCASAADIAAEIKKYRAMELQALKDIGTATAAHDQEWKRARVYALTAIRDELRRLRSATRRQRFTW